MPRSSYIYIAVNLSGSPILACTVKREFLELVDKLRLDKDCQLWRCMDNRPYRRMRLSRQEMNEKRIIENSDTVDEIIADRIRSVQNE